MWYFEFIIFCTEIHLNKKLSNIMFCVCFCMTQQNCFRETAVNNRYVPITRCQHEQVKRTWVKILNFLHIKCSSVLNYNSDVLSLSVYHNSRTFSVTVICYNLLLLCFDKENAMTIRICMEIQKCEHRPTLNTSCWNIWAKNKLLDMQYFNNKNFG